MRLTPVLIVAVAAIGLAGCGSSNDSSPSGSKGYSNAQDVATAASLSTCSPDTDTIATDTVDCTAGTDVTKVDWFGSATALKQWEAIADSIALGGPILYGSNWAIECSDKAQCDDLQGKMGGNVKP